MRYIFVFSIYILILSSCNREKVTREKRLKGLEKRLYNKVAQIVAYNIDGKDMMDTLRKYQLYRKFRYDITFDKTGNVWLRSLITLKDPVINEKKYAFDTSACIPGGGWDVISDNQSEKLRMVYLLPYDCFVATGSTKEAWLRDTFLLPFDHWTILSDNATNMDMAIRKYGKNYYKKISLE